MANVKLYIGSELADFNETFNVLFSIGDIRNLGFGGNNKSYTLNLPLTKTNKRLTSFISEPDVKTEVNSKAYLYLDDLLIIAGKLIILSHDEFSVKCMINSDDWVDDLQNKKMTDLDLSAYDHTLTAANVEASWSAAYPFYRYPHINFGYLQSTEQPAGLVWTSQERWATDFIPMFQVSKIIEAIFSPYTISSTFLSSAAIKDIYILAREVLYSEAFIRNKGLETYATTNNKGSHSWNAGVTHNETLTKNPIDLAPSKDEGADWDAGSFYTVPETGTYRFFAHFELFDDIDIGEFTVNSQTVTVRVYQNANVICEYTDTQSYEIIQGLLIDFDTKNIHCEAGDIIKCYAYLANNATNIDVVPHTITMGVADSVSTFKAHWSDTNRYPGLGKTISAEELMPDMTQLEFLSRIKELANLVFWMDKAKHIVYIEPWTQFISSTIVDLTDYLDCQNLLGELISGNYNKKIIFKWRDDDSDGQMKMWLTWSDSIGKKDITLASVNTKPGELVAEHSFSGIALGFCPNDLTNEIPSIRNIDFGSEDTFKRPAGFNTRIVKWVGLTSLFSWDFEGVTKISYAKVENIDWSDLYSDYLISFYHYVDKGKLYTIPMKVKPRMLSQFYTVVSTAANEGFRPTYLITIDGIDNYFFLQKITTDGVKMELELILKT